MKKVAKQAKTLHLSFINIAYILLFGVVLLGLLLRTVGLLTGNMLFLFDNGHDLLFVKKLAVDHKPLLVGSVSSSIEGYFHGVLWFYMLAIPFILGKGNPVAFTLFMATCSTLSILLTFFTLKKTANVYAGLLGAIIFSFAGFSIATTKFIWNPYPIVWIMPLYFLAIYLFSRQKPIGFPLVTFLTALIIHFEAIYGVCLLPAQAVITILWIVQKQPLKDKLNQGSLSLFLFILPLVPSMIFDVRHHFLITSSLWHAFSSGGNTISHGNIAPIPISQRIILRGVDLFKYSIDSLTPWTVINLLLTVTAGVGVYKLRDKQNNLLFILSLIVVVSPFFIFLLMKYYVWEHYWTGTAPFFAIVVSFAIGKLLAMYSSRKTTIGFIMGSILLTIAYIPWSTLGLWKHGVLQPGEQVFSTQSKVVDTVYAAAGNQSFSVYEETPPVYDFVYRYLFWWKGYTTYHKYPTNEKQPVTFIIRENTPSDPDGAFFKAHVVHIDTPPIKTVTFPGGPTLEEYEGISPEPAVDPNYFPQI